MRVPAFLGALVAFILLSNGVQAGGVYDAPVRNIDGKEASLGAYKGQVMLVVNVASRCGHTRQYAALESAFGKYKDQGFVVLGFPCNQFNGQEPGTAEEIKQFCTSKYHVTFPMFEKIEVNGAGRTPLYDALAGPASPFSGDIQWNFTKFLVGRDGKVIARFEPKTQPDASEVTAAIEKTLAAK